MNTSGPNMYIDPKFRKQMFCHLDILKNKKEFFFKEHPPLQILCAYGRPHQNIEDAVRWIATDIGYNTREIDIPQYLTKEEAYAIEVDASQSICQSEHMCVIVKNYQNSLRTQHSFGLLHSFLGVLEKITKAFNKIMYVICINGHPERLPQKLIKRLPVRCFFRPPGTHDRENIFRERISLIEKHIRENKNVFEWLSWEIPSTYCSDLADYSKFATSGQIHSFLREVYEHILLASYSSNEPPLIVNSEYIQKFLEYDSSGSQTIDRTLSSKLDQEYFKYAGETTTIEDVDSAKAENAIFSVPEKKEQKSTMETSGKRQKTT